MYLMAKLFECHDRSRYVIHAYSYGMGSDDGMRNRLLEAVDEFHDVRSLSDSDIAGLARSHDIDIAVDLKGHTQHARMGIFSYRAALFRSVTLVILALPEHLSSTTWLQTRWFCRRKAKTITAKKSSSRHTVTRLTMIHDRSPGQSRPGKTRPARQDWYLLL